MLYDSAVIVEYLDSKHGNKLIPSGSDRWQSLTLQSLADGVMEADIRWQEERNGPAEARRELIVAGMRSKVEGTLHFFERSPPAAVNIGAIAAASALAHLDFRFPEVPWRLERPRLRDWYEDFAGRPSMIQTVFYQ